MIGLEFLEKNKNGQITKDINTFKENFFADYHWMTESEMVSAIFKELEGIDMIIPIEVECPECESSGKYAVDLREIKNESGEILDKFEICYNNHTFTFTRVAGVDSPIKPKLLDIFNYMAIWMNQEDISYVKENFNLSNIVDLCKLFNERIFNISFKTNIKCKCEHQFEYEFGLTLDDLREFLHQL